ncbi:MAG: hypothetical protein ACPF9W_13080, partial [Nocardioides sp.]
DLAGDLTDLGQSITVVTDEDGEADFQIGVERSEEFDDDGMAEFDVTATAAGDTDTEEFEFDSSNPLNVGDVIIDFAEVQPEVSNVLPMAPTTDDTRYTVMTTDQFGNMAGDVDVELDADNSGMVSDDEVTTDVESPAMFDLSSNRAADVTPTGTVEGVALVLDADGDAVEGDDVEVTGDGPATQFYAVDFA